MNIFIIKPYFVTTTKSSHMLYRNILRNDNSPSTIFYPIFKLYDLWYYLSQHSVVRLKQIIFHFVHTLYQLLIPRCCAHTKLIMAYCNFFILAMSWVTAGFLWLCVLCCCIYLPSACCCFCCSRTLACSQSAVFLFYLIQLRRNVLPPLLCCPLMACIHQDQELRGSR